MGHGKETPRQKMIGMMYLVLTALLALNVSAEILNAFILIDKSLAKTGDNFQKKNEDIYTKFTAAYEQNKDKVKPYKDKADEIRKLSKGLVDYMTYLQVTIVTKADGPKSTYKEHGPDAIQKKDDNNIPGEIMILNKRGDSLKQKLDTYRERSIAIVNEILKKVEEKRKKSDPNAKVQNQLVETINTLLSTNDVIGEDGKVPWVTANFDHLPLAAVTAMLSKMKADIRNVEADIITFLLEQIEASSFKFNKLEAIVKSSTNYVLQGGKYEAEVFIAASDTTQAPEIILGGGSKLPIKEGKGLYTGATGSIGIQKWGGVIKVKNPQTGDVTDYPFDSEFTVAAPSISVSPDKMNVFYVGVPNPVSISASGVPADKLRVSIDQGASITQKAPGKFEVFVKNPGTKVKISVNAELPDKSSKFMGASEFRVKVVPDPVPVVGTDKWRKGGVAPIASLVAQSGVRAELENFDFELTYLVTSFKVTAMVKGFEEEASSNSAAFTAEQKALIRKVGPGKKVYIEDVNAKGPDGGIRRIGTISFKLQ